MSKERWLRFSLITFILMSLFFILYHFDFSKPKVVNVGFTNKIQEVLPSVVHIQCDQWQGSGVALTPDIVATARHVVDGTHYTITFQDNPNRTISIDGVQAISHKDYDVGFIKVSAPILHPAKFGSIKDCVLGQSIFIIGSPYGKMCFNNVTLGIISNLNPDWDITDRYTGEKYGWKVAFLSDSAAHPGNSGGPVFTMDGVARGLLVGGISPVLNCSMPSDLFLNDVENIKVMFALDKYRIEGKEEKSVNVYMESIE